MGDLDLSKSFGKALKKLVADVGRGIGAVARPWIRKRDAQADIDVKRIRLRGRHALKLLAAKYEAEEAAMEAANAPIEVHAEVVEEEAPLPLLEARARHRLDYQEAKRQLNVEEVVAHAHEALRDVPDAEVADEPVDDDWIARFFTNVQDVSSDEMKQLWGRILAGEVKRPGSFSLRCLETIRNMSQQEALLFARVSEYVFAANKVVRAEDSFNGFIATSDLRWDQYLALADAGLIIAERDGAYRLGSESKGRFTSALVLGDVIIKLDRVAEEPPLVLPTFTLTGAGEELAKLLRPKVDRKYLRWLVETVRAQGFTTTLFRIEGWRSDGFAIRESESIDLDDLCRE